MLLNDRHNLNRLLEAISEELDIPDYVYEDATLKYEDVGEHLADADSSLAAYQPKVYPQGSFRLGTVVRPLAADDEYDIDLVCQLSIGKQSTSQDDLKTRVGARLRARVDLADMLTSCRRCWRLDYPGTEHAPRFHMDVLPCIPNEELPPTGILLTDVELVRWQKSNPIAYAEWFRERMAVAFRTRRAALAESMNASVEEVPEWRVKTPLQRVVQILKRHRDIYFDGDPDHKPVSIIITTLAAHAYQNEDDLFDALTEITKRLPAFIEEREGQWWVQNPVDPGENFADKWNEDPERREAFFTWMRAVGEDIKRLTEAPGVREGVRALEESIGRTTMHKVAGTLGVEAREGSSLVKRDTLVPQAGDTSHVLRPLWPMVDVNKASLRTTVHRKYKSKRLFDLKNIVPKGAWLSFMVKTNVPEPFSVQWQVVNTGREAMAAGQPRGDFYDSDAPRTLWEKTAYRGTHWVEAFVIKDGICVARSGKQLVRVWG